MMSPGGFPAAASNTGPVASPKIVQPSVSVLKVLTARGAADVAWALRVRRDPMKIDKHR